MPRVNGFRDAQRGCNLNAHQVRARTARRTRTHAAARTALRDASPRVSLHRRGSCLSTRPCRGSVASEPSEGAPNPLARRSHAHRSAGSSLPTRGRASAPPRPPRERAQYGTIFAFSLFVARAAAAAAYAAAAAAAAPPAPPERALPLGRGFDAPAARPPAQTVWYGRFLPVLPGVAAKAAAGAAYGALAALVLSLVIRICTIDPRDPWTLAPARGAQDTHRFSGAGAQRASPLLIRACMHEAQGPESDSTQRRPDRSRMHGGLPHLRGG